MIGLPFNRLSSFRRAALAGVDHRKFESGITFLLTDGRQDRDVSELDLQRDFCDFASVVPHFDFM